MGRAATISVIWSLHLLVVAVTSGSTSAPAPLRPVVDIGALQEGPLDGQDGFHFWSPSSCMSTVVSRGGAKAIQSGLCYHGQWTYRDGTRLELMPEGGFVEADLEMYSGCCNKGAMVYLQRNGSNTSHFVLGFGLYSPNYARLLTYDGNMKSLSIFNRVISLNRRYVVRVYTNFSSGLVTMTIDGGVAFEDIACPSLTEDTRLAWMHEGARLHLRHDGLGGGGRFYRLEYFPGFSLPAVPVPTSSTSSTSTSSTVTTDMTMATTTSMGTVGDSVCHVKDVVLCPAPPGAWLVRFQSCTLTSTVAEPLLRISRTLCPPSKREFRESEVVERYDLVPIFPDAPQFIDPSRREFTCSCISPRYGSGEIDPSVPTLPPGGSSGPGIRNFSVAVHLCSDQSCDRHVEASVAGRSRFDFEVTSNLDDKERLEVEDLVACPSPDASDAGCEIFVRDKCVLERWTWLDLNFRRGSGVEAHRLFWNMSSFAFYSSSQMHLFVNIRRCDTSNASLLALCGRCISGSDSGPSGGGNRRLQVQGQDDEGEGELDFDSSGDEAVLLLSTPRTSTGPGGGSSTQVRHVEIPLGARGTGSGVSADDLLKVAEDGARSTWPGARVSGLAFANRLEEGRQTNGVLRVTLDVPAAEDARQWDSSVLRQGLAGLGLLLAPAPAPSPAPTPASREGGGEGPEGSMVVVLLVVMVVLLVVGCGGAVCLGLGHWLGLLSLSTRCKCSGSLTSSLEDTLGSTGSAATKMGKTGEGLEDGLNLVL